MGPGQETGVLHTEGGNLPFGGGTFPDPSPYVHLGRRGDHAQVKAPGTRDLGTIKKKAIQRARKVGADAL